MPIRSFSLLPITFNKIKRTVGTMKASAVSFVLLVIYQRVGASEYTTIMQLRFLQL